MQANFQLLTGDLAIGGGLHLPVTQPWAATNIVYWVNGYFVVICIRQILDIVPYFVWLFSQDTKTIGCQVSQKKKKLHTWYHKHYVSGIYIFTWYKNHWVSGVVLNIIKKYLHTLQTKH